MTADKIEFSGAEHNRLAADRFGSGGRPVLFLHGGGQTRRAWDATARRVAAAGMTAIAVDLRGHGESEWVASGNYTFADFAADAAAVFRQTAERFGAAPVAVGASLGGLASLTAELSHGPLLDALVLVDITPRMDPEGVAKVQGFMGERIADGFATLEEAAQAIARYLPHRKKPASLEGLGKNLRRSPDGRYRWHWDPAFMTGTRSINAGTAALMDEVDRGLPRLAIPVLLVRGMQSELVQETHARDFMASVPNGRTVDVSGAGHMVAGDKNDAFCAAILDFLAARKAA